MRDARGWYLHEKVRVVVGFWAFMALDAVARGVYAVTLHRLDIFRINGKGNRGQTNRLWDFWIWLASQGYCYGDWRKGDMPEHQRIGGVWS